MKSSDTATALAALQTLISALRSLLGDTQEGDLRGGEHYTSRGPLPPGVTRRRFNEIAGSIGGSWKDGRVWVVPVDAWRNERHRPERRQNSGGLSAPSPRKWSAESALRAAGIAPIAGTGDPS